MKATVVYSVSQDRWVVIYSEGADPDSFLASIHTVEWMEQFKPSPRAGGMILAALRSANPGWTVELELN